MPLVTVKMAGRATTILLLLACPLGGCGALSGGGDPAAPQTACAVDTAWVAAAELTAEWEAGVYRRTLELRAACLRIAGWEVADLSSDGEVAQLNEACRAAAIEIQDAQATGDALTLRVSPPSCTAAPSVESDCNKQCGEDVTCASLCAAEKLIETTCALPTVVATGVDPAFAALLNTNLPHVFLVAEAGADQATTLLEALVTATRTIAQPAECTTETNDWRTDVAVGVGNIQGLVAAAQVVISEL